MHNNAFILKRYADYLHDICLHQKLVQCVSTSPTDLHLLFSNDFYLSIRFYKQHTFFLLPEADHFPKKNVQTQCAALVGKEVKSVKPYENDRGFQFFIGKLVLHIQCYGRRSGVLITKGSSVIDHFKTLQPPETIDLKNREVEFYTDALAFQKNNPFVTNDIITDLQKQSFVTSSNQKDAWLQYTTALVARPIYVCKSEQNEYSLTLFPTDEIIETYSDIGKAQHDFGKLYMAHDRFDALKTSLLSRINKDIKKLRSRKVKIDKHLTKLTEGDSLKEIADVIMANLHVIPAKATEVTLFNFYTNKDIDIRLKENLTAQKNAERYYQKSKNVHVEIAHNKKLQTGIIKQLEALEKEKEAIEQTDNYRSLQSFEKVKTKSDDAAKSNHQLPYRLFTFQDYEIWVGKSAKHNDALLKLAHKNDLWLHARGVAGSHVLLKNRENRKVSKEALEFAASLAARFSKNQHDTLAAVIYTSPKYVRKFKGALPGQVRVDREEVVLVAPYIIKN